MLILNHSLSSGVIIFSSLLLFVVIAILVTSPSLFVKASSTNLVPSSLDLSIYQTSVSQNRYLLNGWQTTPSETITVGPLSISAITFFGNGTVRILVVNLASGFSRLVPLAASTNPDGDPWQLESASPSPGIHIQVTCAFASPPLQQTSSSSVFYFCFWDPVTATSTVAVFTIVSAPNSLASLSYTVPGVGISNKIISAAPAHWFSGSSSSSTIWCAIIYLDNTNQRFYLAQVDLSSSFSIIPNSIIPPSELQIQQEVEVGNMVASSSSSSSSAAVVVIVFGNGTVSTFDFSTKTRIRKDSSTWFVANPSSSNGDYYYYSGVRALRFVSPTSFLLYKPSTSVVFSRVIASTLTSEKDYPVSPATTKEELNCFSYDSKKGIFQTILVDSPSSTARLLLLSAHWARNGELDLAGDVSLGTPLPVNQRIDRKYVPSNNAIYFISVSPSIISSGTWIGILSSSPLILKITVSTDTNGANHFYSRTVTPIYIAPTAAPTPIPPPPPTTTAAPPVAMNQIGLDNSTRAVLYTISYLAASIPTLYFAPTAAFSVMRGVRLDLFLCRGGVTTSHDVAIAFFPASLVPTIGVGDSSKPGSEARLAIILFLAGTLLAILVALLRPKWSSETGREQWTIPPSMQVQLDRVHQQRKQAVEQQIVKETEKIQARYANVLRNNSNVNNGDDDNDLLGSPSSSSGKKKKSSKNKDKNTTNKNNNNSDPRLQRVAQQDMENEIVRVRQRILNSEVGRQIQQPPTIPNDFKGAPGKPRPLVSYVGLCLAQFLVPWGMSAGFLFAFTDTFSQAIAVIPFAFVLIYFLYYVVQLAAVTAIPAPKSLRVAPLIVHRPKQIDAIPRNRRAELLKTESQLRGFLGQNFLLGSASWEVPLFAQEDEVSFWNNSKFVFRPFWGPFETLAGIITPTGRPEVTDTFSRIFSRHFFTVAAAGALAVAILQGHGAIDRAFCRNYSRMIVLIINIVTCLVFLAARPYIIPLHNAVIGTIEVVVMFTSIVASYGIPDIDENNIESGSSTTFAVLEYIVAIVCIVGGLVILFFGLWARKMLKETGVQLQNPTRRHMNIRKENGMAFLSIENLMNEDDDHEMGSKKPNSTNNNNNNSNDYDDYLLSPQRKNNNKSSSPSSPDKKSKGGKKGGKKRGNNEDDYFEKEEEEIRNNDYSPPREIITCSTPSSTTAMSPPRRVTFSNEILAQEENQKPKTLSKATKQKDKNDKKHGIAKENDKTDNKKNEEPPSASSPQQKRLVNPKSKFVAPLTDPKQFPDLFEELLRSSANNSKNNNNNNNDSSTRPQSKKELFRRSVPQNVAALKNEVQQLLDPQNAVAPEGGWFRFLKESNKLRNFYDFYLPPSTPAHKSDEDIENILRAWAGEYREMWKELFQMYGPFEFPRDEEEEQQLQESSPSSSSPSPPSSRVSFQIVGNDSETLGEDLRTEQMENHQLRNRLGVLEQEMHRMRTQSGPWKQWRSQPLLNSFDSLAVTPSARGTSLLIPQQQNSPQNHHGTNNNRSFSLSNTPNTAILGNSLENDSFGNRNRQSESPSPDVKVIGRRHSSISVSASDNDDQDVDSYFGNVNNRNKNINKKNETSSPPQNRFTRIEVADDGQEMSYDELMNYLGKNDQSEATTTTTTKNNNSSRNNEQEDFDEFYLPPSVATPAFVIPDYHEFELEAKTKLEQRDEKKRNQEHLGVFRLDSDEEDDIDYTLPAKALTTIRKKFTWNNNNNTGSENNHKQTFAVPIV